jgi:small subunit ribosomal protein S9
LSTDEPTPTPDDEAGRTDDQPEAEAADTRPASSPDAGSDSPAEEVAAEEPVAAEPEAEPPAEQPAEEAPEPEAEPVAAADEAARAADDQPAEPAEAAPVAEAEEAAGDQASGDAAEEEFEAAPREKPEIPGADLDPVFVPEEERYLDAEAQAAAEAEAEAQAERLRAEAEDEAAMPIADAAIDLAAGARYTATGKRKTAVARVILRPGKGTYTINGKELEAFFPRDTLQRMIRQPLETVGYEARMDVVARMHGGGVASQAGALRHGISRALIVADPNLRSELKRRGFLTRDPRVKERKKAGLKKARKRPQFSKR